MSEIRVRFAPSPTGYLHIGGARTALFNYLIAKKLGGKFILRIEDTDLLRSTPESIQAIIEGMNWLGLSHDEGPFYQTERFDLYQKYIDLLIEEEKAYPCFCTPEILDEKRKQAQKEKRKPMYDRSCQALSKDEAKQKIEKGEKHCIRFKSSDEGEIVIEDLVKGTVKVAAKELDDLIIRRADGSPTYNLTVVIDDATMNMSHVIRGDDHLNNTPRQIQLYEALNFEIPKFAHVPMILGTDKKRLSKRHGATSVTAYRDMGYLPEALLNYLVKLGWSFEDKEVFSMQEMIEHFSFEGISKSAGVFNPEKLDWLNGIYLREAKPERIVELLKPILSSKEIETDHEEKLKRAVEFSLEKVKTLEEMADFISCIYVRYEMDEKLKGKTVNEKSLPHIQLVYDKLVTVENFTEEDLKSAYQELMDETGLGMGKLAGPVRSILSGRKISPSAFQMLELLGKEESLNRLKECLD